MAREAIAQLTGPIALELRSNEVWARLSTERLLRLVSEEPADNLVAGTGFEPVTFGL